MTNRLLNIDYIIYLFELLLCILLYINKHNVTMGRVYIKRAQYNKKYIFTPLHI